MISLTLEDAMLYKGFEFDFEFGELIPPLPGGSQGEYHFAAKISYMRSPAGKLLWKTNGPLSESWGYSKIEAQEKATQIAQKWIDQFQIWNCCFTCRCTHSNPSNTHTLCQGNA